MEGKKEKGNEQNRWPSFQVIQIGNLLLLQSRSNTQNFTKHSSPHRSGNQKSDQINVGIILSNARTPQYSLTIFLTKEEMNLQEFLRNKTSNSSAKNSGNIRVSYPRERTEEEMMLTQNNLV